MPENTKNIPVRLPLPLHKAATLKRVNDNEKSLQDVIVRLLSHWVDQTAMLPTKGPTEYPDPDHQMLDVILTKGTKGQILGIRSNLKAFNDAIELSDLKAGKSPHSKRKTG